MEDAFVAVDPVMQGLPCRLRIHVRLLRLQAAQVGIFLLNPSFGVVVVAVVVVIHTP